MYWKCNFLVKTKKCIQYYFIFKTPKCFSTGYWFLRIQNFYGHFSRSINTRWLSQTFICKLCQTTTNKQPWWQNFKGEKLMKSFIIDDKGQILFLHTYIHDDTPRAVSFAHKFCKKYTYILLHYCKEWILKLMFFYFFWRKPAAKQLFLCL